MGYHLLSAGFRLCTVAADGLQQAQLLRGVVTVGSSQSFGYILWSLYVL